MSTNNNQYGKEVKPKWKSGAQESSKITKLSGAKLKSMVSNEISACTALTLSNRGITKLEDLEGFSDVLHRVDLSNNAITRLQGFSHTPGISMLNVSKNELSGDSALEDLRYLTELRTLNISENPNIKYIRSHVAKPLQKLQALIAKECGFEKISFLKFIPTLNTLILSSNSISDFSISEVGTFANLTKLSIGKNMLKVIPDLSASPNLTELRVNNNMLTTINDSILNNKKLKLLDVSNNLLTNWDDVRLLVGLPFMTSLAVKGNKFPPPPESTDDLETREDKAAETIDDIMERRYRRFVLSIFLRNVGAAKKTFEQLIVLDMKRVKMKLSPGMSANPTADESAVSLRPTKNAKLTHSKIDSQDDTSSTSRSAVADKSALASPSPTYKKRKLLNEEEENTETAEEVTKIKNKKSEIAADGTQILKVKKKNSKKADEGFLNSNEEGKGKGKGGGGGKKEEIKEEGNNPVLLSAAAMGSGVLEVIVHKKPSKTATKQGNNANLSDSLKNKDSLVKDKSKKDEKKIISSITDDEAVSSMLAASSSVAFGVGGSSAW